MSHRIFVDLDNVPHEILCLFEDIQQKDTLVQGISLCVTWILYVNPFAACPDAYASIKKKEEELRDAIRDSKTDQDYVSKSPKKGSKAKPSKEPTSAAAPIFNDDQQLALYEGIQAEFVNAKVHALIILYGMTDQLIQIQLDCHGGEDDLVKKGSRTGT